MASRVRNARLGYGEYIVPADAANSQIVAARLELIQQIKLVVPRCFEQLRVRIYPKFARYARAAEHLPRRHRGPGYWETAWKFSTWEIVSGPNRFKPLLLAWAQEFHVDEETWMLEGALETLSAWYTIPAWREALDVRGFCYAPAGSVLLDFETFSFEDSGWSPQFERWSHYRARVQRRFEQRLQNYADETRKVIESRGGQRSRQRYSQKNFTWFAQYQIGGMSSVQIENRRGAAKGDESTVLKGIRTAAELLGWKRLRSDGPSNNITRIGNSQ